MAQPTLRKRSAVTSQGAAQQRIAKPRADRGMPLMLALLCTGTSLTLFSQFLSNKGAADPHAQLISWVKYAATLAVNGWAARGRGRGERKTRRVQVLLAAMALLDVAAYAAFVVGFSICGAAQSTVLFAATGQVFTAALSVGVLRKRLSWGQLTSVAIVCAGLALRAGSTQLLEQLRRGELAGLASGLSRDDLLGLAAVLVAALLYSALGVVYESLLKQPGAPTHAVIMAHVAAAGLSVTSAYQLLYTVPRWGRLVSAPLAAQGVGVGGALLLFGGFGALFNVHAYVQGLMFGRQGALAVGLVNAARGAAVSVAAAALFCSDAAPRNCLTRWSGASAAAVSAGMALWVASKRPDAPPPAEEVGPKRD